MAAEELALPNWLAPVSDRNGVINRRWEVGMGVLVVLGCWLSAMFYFFGRKILSLYDVVVSMLTHFVPLGPIVLIVLVVALIVLLAPKRVVD